MLRRFTPDLRILLLLALPPLLLFWQQTLGGRTLLPADNLYQYEPWAGMREQVGAPAVPHNALVSDLVLQNYPWKHFLRQSLEAGERRSGTRSNSAASPSSPPGSTRRSTPSA